MAENFTVSLDKIIKEFKLESIYLPEKEVLIDTADVNRPGLQMVGFYDYFDATRIQILGRVENSYLEDMTSKERYEHLGKFFEKRVPAVIVA